MASNPSGSGRPIQVGDRVRRKGERRSFRVTDVFMASGVPAMLIGWRAWNPSTGKVGPRGQVMTLREPHDWIVVRRAP